MTVKKAIIPCAGFGTRFLPSTKVLPKETFPIVDTPALYYILDEAAASGIEEVLIIISPQKQYIKKMFMPNAALNERLLACGDKDAYALANRDFGMKISFAVQRQMNGNAMAIKLGQRFVKGEPFAVLFGDDVMYTADGVPVTRQLINAFEEVGGASVVGCQQTPESVARRCGVMIAGEALNERITAIKGIEEKPKGELPSKLVSLGRFVLSPDIFDVIGKAQTTCGEVYLSDAISVLAQSQPVYAFEFEGRRYDIGNREGYLEAIVEYALRDGRLNGEFESFLKGLKL